MKCLSGQLKQCRKCTTPLCVGHMIALWLMWILSDQVSHLTHSSATETDMGRTCTDMIIPCLHPIAIRLRSVKQAPRGNPKDRLLCVREHS